MDFIGSAICKNEDEMLDALGRLATMPNVKVEKSGLRFVVSYTPKDTETYRESEKTIARLVDILEAIEDHGFCTID